MFRKLLTTSDDWTLTLLRLIMGLVFFPHGAQKALGWFGGYGFSGTMGFFTHAQHVPAVFAFLAICGIPRQSRPDCRSPGPGRGVWDRLQHGGCGSYRPSPKRVFHELDRTAEG